VHRYVRGRQWKEKARLRSGKRQKVMKNRRQRRYSINNLIFELHNMHRYDHDNVKWLETHKWMRKRMKMKEIWGYSIATKHMGRGMKSAIRATESHCIIHDMSYIKPIEVLVHESMDIFLNDIFSEFVDPSSSFLETPTVAEYKEVSLLAYSRGSFPHHCQGPIKVCYLPSASAQMRPNKLWIWTHPSFYTEFRDELQQCLDDYYSANCDEGSEKIVVQNITSGINRFSIVGMGAASLIAKAFSVHKSVSDHNTGIFYSKVINSEGLLRVWQNGQIVGINVKDYRYLLDSGIITSNGRSYERMIWPDGNSTCSQSGLWDDQNRARASTIFEPDHQLNMKKSMLNSARIHLKSLSSATSGEMPFVLDQIVFPLLIIRNDLANRVHSTDIKSVPGWDIIVPSRWGASLFNHLHLLGGRAIGIEELEYLQLYHGHISFPRDFPDTKVGEMYWLDKSIELNKRVCSRKNCKTTKVAKLTNVTDSDDSTDSNYCTGNSDSDNDDSDNEGAISPCNDGEMGIGAATRSFTDFDNKVAVNADETVITAEESVIDDNFFKDFVIVREKEYLDSFDPLLPTSDGIVASPLPALPFSTLVTVLLHRVGKGMPAVGAAIYSPLLNDYRLCVHHDTNKTKQTSLRGARLGEWAGVELSNIPISFNGHIFSCNTNDLKDENGSRKLLGYVTGGSQCNYRFNDKAVGLCDITKLHESYLALIEASSSRGKTRCEHGCSLVLYRNPNSKWLRPALSKII